jgi:hypothetical protein
MASKVVNKKAAGTSKVSTNSVGSGTTSKKDEGATIVGKEKSNVGRANIQVIFNGKIATPVSLLSRTKAPLKQTLPAGTAPKQTKVVDAGADEEKVERAAISVKPSGNTRSRYVLQILRCIISIIFTRLIVLCCICIALS